MDEHGRGLRQLALADHAPSWSPRPRSGWRSRPSTATMPTGSRPGRRKTVAPCWCGGARAARRRTSRRRPSTCGRGCTSTAAAPMRRGAASSSRSTSPTSGSGACTAAAGRPRSRPRAARGCATPTSSSTRRATGLFAVREDHRGGGEPVNSIVALGLDRPDDAGSEVALGHDFFSSPRLSPDRRRLAWLSWDHPDMPWDSDRAVAGGDRGERADRRGAPGRGRGRGGDRPAGLVARRRALLRVGPNRLVEPPSAGRRRTDARLPDVCRICRAGLDLRRAVVRLPQRRRHPGLLRSGWSLASGDHRGRHRRADADRSALHRTGRRSASPTAARCCAPARPTGRRRSCCSSPRAETVSELARAGDLPVDPAWLAGAAGGRVPERAGPDRPRLLLPADQPGVTRRPPGERPPLIVKSHGGPDRQHLERAEPSAPSSGPRAALRCATSTTAAAPATAAPTASAWRGAGARSTSWTA